MIEPTTITELGKKQGWKIRDHQPNICLLILERGKEQMNVYYSKMTVATIVPHPKGKKQLFRKNVSLAQLMELLRKPRTHTGKGYSTTTPPRHVETIVEGVAKPEPAAYHPTDTQQFYERENFPDPEAILVEQLWGLKPRFYDTIENRKNKRKEAIALAHIFLYGKPQTEVSNGK